MTPEGKVKERVKKVCKELGAHVIMPVMGSAMGARGVPDLLICIDGRFVAIETKAKRKDKPTLIQALALRDVVKAGGQAFVIDGENTIADIRNVLQWKYANQASYDGVNRWLDAINHHYGTE